MIELTATARERLNDYLDELRRVLGECPTLDAAEVEQDVQSHIQTALATEAAPVDDNRLDAVLRSLGAPGDWVQDQRVPWFRRPPAQWWQDVRSTASTVTQRIASGPESFRLPYLSLLTLTVGFCAAFIFRDGGVVTLIAALAAFVMARAAVAVHAEHTTSAAQKWLLGPALLIVYVPLGLVLFGWTIGAGVGLSVETEQMRFYRQVELRHREDRTNAAIKQLERSLAAMNRYEGSSLPAGTIEVRDSASVEAEIETLKQRLAADSALIRQYMDPPRWAGIEWTPGVMIVGTVLLTGAWWLALGLITWMNPGLLPALFRPFIPRGTGRGGLILAGLVCCCSLEAD